MCRIGNEGENFNHMMGFDKNRHCKRFASE